MQIGLNAMENTELNTFDDIKSYIQNTAREIKRYRNDPGKLLDNLYLEEVGGATKFNPYDFQRKLIKDFLVEHYLIINKSRQTGISTIFTIMSAILMSLYSNYTIGVISKDATAAYKFVSKVRDVLNKLPAILKPKKFIKDNEKSIKLPNGSSIQAAAVSRSDPNKALRSESMSLLILDEAAFVNRIGEAYSGIRPTLNKTKQVCSAKGIPYGIVIVSTPNGMVGDGEWFFNMVQLSKANKTKFKFTEIHWSLVPSYDQAWYDDQVREEPNERIIKQELDLVFLGSSESAFDDDVIEAIQHNTRNVMGHTYESIIFNNTLDPEYKALVNDSYKLAVIEQPKDNEKYFIGCDVAPAYGKCKSSIQVLNSKGIQVAEFNHKCKVRFLYKALRNIMDKYSNCLTIFENNSFGNQIIEMFDYDDEFKDERGKYIDRLYKTEIKDKQGRITDTKLGLTVTGKNRDVLMDNMYTFIKENPEVIKTSTLASETISLQRKNGRLMHGTGGTDDNVLAYTHALYCRDLNIKGTFLSVAEKLPKKTLQNASNNTITIMSEIDSNILHATNGRDPSVILYDGYVPENNNTGNNIDPYFNKSIYDL